MATTESNTMELGSHAIDFNLLDVISGKYMSLKDISKESGLVIMFLCAHCPYVKHIEKKIGMVAHQYLNKKIGFTAICSNDIEVYPEDSPEMLRLQAEENDFSFPYFLDETQEVARTYQAVCTPEFFLFDENLKCIYHGRFDSSTPSNNKLVSGHDLTEAIETHLKGEPPLKKQLPSIGCSIKWKY